MAEIVAFRKGDAVPVPGQPNPDVVEALEAMLEQARSGEIHGLRMIVLHTNGTASGVARGLLNYSMVGMVHSMSVDMVAELNAADAKNP